MAGRREQGTLLAYWIVASWLWRMGCTVIPANVASTFSRTPFCFPADRLQVATGRLKIRVAEPQLDRPDVNASQQVHARECVAELVKVELLADRVRLARDWLPEVGRFTMAAVQFATLCHSP